MMILHLFYLFAKHNPWWRHQMETFSALLALCAGIHRWIPSQRPLTQSFDVFFDLRLNKRSSKQSLGWWFETPSRSLWRHWNATATNNQVTKSEKSEVILKITINIKWRPFVSEHGLRCRLCECRDQSWTTIQRNLDCRCGFRWGIFVLDKQCARFSQPSIVLRPCLHTELLSFEVDIFLLNVSDIWLYSAF